MENNKIIITDENNSTQEFNILFTYEHLDNKYVFCFKDGDEDTILPFKYDEHGNAYIVDDEDELASLDEVLSSYDRM